MSTKQDITSFDTRTVKFYDGNKSYTIDFSIATLRDGRKVAYAKKFFGYDADLTKKIQVTEGRGSQSPFNQQPVSDNSIPHPTGIVNGRNETVTIEDWQDPVTRNRQHIPTAREAAQAVDDGNVDELLHNLSAALGEDAADSEDIAPVGSSAEQVQRDAAETPFTM